MPRGRPLRGAACAAAAAGRAAAGARTSCATRCARTSGRALRADRSPYCCNSCPVRLGGGCRHPYRFYQAKWFGDSRRQAQRVQARHRLRPRGVRGGDRADIGGLARAEPAAHNRREPREISVQDAQPVQLPGRSQPGDLTKLEDSQGGALQAQVEIEAGKASNIPRGRCRGQALVNFARSSGRPRQRRRGGHGGGQAGRDSQCVLTLFVRRIGSVLRAAPRQDGAASSRPGHPAGALRRPGSAGLRAAPLRPRQRFSDAERMERGRNGVKS